MVSFPETYIYPSLLARLTSIDKSSKVFQSLTQGIRIFPAKRDVTSKYPNDFRSLPKICFVKWEGIVNVLLLNWL